MLLLSVLVGGLVVVVVVSAVSGCGVAGAVSVAAILPFVDGVVMGRSCSKSNMHSQPAAWIQTLQRPFGSRSLVASGRCTSQMQPMARSSWTLNWVGRTADGLRWDQGVRAPVVVLWRASWWEAVSVRSVVGDALAG